MQVKLQIDRVEIDCSEFFSEVAPFVCGCLSFAALMGFVMVVLPKLAGA